ncbi:MAG TPA: hypothetical protein VFC79_07400, partial [Tissierellaceae bacterium]|nr:hypothetical protein [Tissierellaceae bacterium]
MIVSITNNIVTDLKTKYPDIPVLREFPQTNPKLPCIIVDEGDLAIDLGTMDSGGYHHTNYDITLEIYTNGSGKISKSNDIREGI